MIKRVGSTALLALASTLLAVGGTEAVFRVAGFDFEQKERELAKVPIYYRRPTQPIGDAFFHRPGPAQWKGRVLQTMLRRAGVPETLLPEDPERVYRYDADGFRNPLGMQDWEVVVVGDSFTELGYLADEDLFSARAVAPLGLRARNLGASFTGPLTHVTYLREFGAAPSLRHAVLAFFEGNDVENLRREERWEREAREARAAAPDGRLVRVPLDFHPPQTSFVRALYRRLFRPHAELPPHEPNFIYFLGEATQPVSIRYTPPNAQEIPPRMREVLDDAFARWATTSRELGARPWLLYLPCKLRVLHGAIEPTGESHGRLAEWTPTDLPQYVGERSRHFGIEFVDATPALRQLALEGTLPFNAVLDTHANRAGSHAIGRVLEKALSPVP